MNVVHKKLSAEGLNEGLDFIVLCDLIGISEEFELKLEELQSLHTQDRHKDFGDGEALLTVESLTLHGAHKPIEKVTIQQIGDRSASISSLTL